MVVVVHLIPHSTTTTISISGTSCPSSSASSSCHRSQECGNIDKNKEREKDWVGGGRARWGEGREGRKPSSTRARLLAPKIKAEAKETQNRNPKQKLRSANSAEYFIISLLALFITITTTTRQTTIGQKAKHNLNKFRKISSNCGGEEGWRRQGESCKCCQNLPKFNKTWSVVVVELPRCYFPPLPHLPSLFQLLLLPRLPRSVLLFRFKSQ